MTRISTAELANRTREIVDQVRRGEWTVVESQGGEQVVLVDALDYRLLRALAAYAMRAEGEPLEVSAESPVLRDYLDEKISLGKVAELLQVSRFELMDRFKRLGIPLRVGPASLEEARAEIAAARRLG
jgi:prevent-host-death family protein